MKCTVSRSRWASSAHLADASWSRFSPIAVTPSSASRSTSVAGKNFVTTTRAGSSCAPRPPWPVRIRACTSPSRAGELVPPRRRPPAPPLTRSLRATTPGEPTGPAVASVGVEVVALAGAAGHPAHLDAGVAQLGHDPGRDVDGRRAGPRHRGAHRLRPLRRRHASPRAPRSTARRPTVRRRRPPHRHPGRASRRGCAARRRRPAPAGRRARRPRPHRCSTAAPARSRRRARPGPPRVDRVTTASQLGGTSGTPSTTATSAPWHWSM